MASTFAIIQSVGAANTTGTGDYLDLKSTDTISATSTAYKNDPLTIPDADTSSKFSFSAWFRGKWTGTFNSITNVTVWETMGIGNTGVTLLSGRRHHDGVGWEQPGDAWASSYVTCAIATTEAAGIHLTPTAAISASQVFSRFLVLQMAVASGASVGDAFTKSSGFNTRWKWTES